MLDYETRRAERRRRYESRRIQAEIEETKRDLYLCVLLFLIIVSFVVAGIMDSPYTAKHDEWMRSMEEQGAFVIR